MPLISLIAMAIISRGSNRVAPSILENPSVLKNSASAGFVMVNLWSLSTWFQVERPEAQCNMIFFQQACVCASESHTIQEVVVSEKLQKRLPSSTHSVI